jgi:hypothetical protein
MKSQFLPIALLSFIPCLAGNSFAESVNHAPPFQVYQRGPELQDLFPAKGSSNLCWPSSLAHRMFYFQNYVQPPLKNLSLPTTAGHLDVKTAVKTFVQLCHTGVETGTPQAGKVSCISQYFKQNGYNVEAFAIGQAGRYSMAAAGVAGVPTSEYRPVEISDLRKYISQGYAVILHVGWLKFDKRRREWVQSRSHSLNAYGYDYDPSWGTGRIVLKVANPDVDYSSRPTTQYFDSVTVSELRRKPGIRYPAMANLVVRGPGFDNRKRLPVLEDVFVFRPR